MSAVRRFNASCPDCGRWRCVCDAYEGPDYTPAPVPVRTAQPVRAVPPPPAIRARLAELRAEFAK